MLALGGLIASCGGGSGDGYVATGAAGASPERPPGRTVAPTGGVRMIPLDGAGEAGRSTGPTGPAGPTKNGRGGPKGTPSGPQAAADGDSEGKSPGGTNARTPAAEPSRSGGAAGSSAPGTPQPSSGPDATRGPARLRTGEPRREPTDKRWCEKVTLTFTNTGGSPVRSGEITFGTHIIGALGADWATIDSTRRLPTPLAPGERTSRTWRICVAEWRVPLGMHIETRDTRTRWS